MFRKIISLSVAGLVAMNATTGIGAPKGSFSPAPVNNGTGTGGGKNAPKNSDHASVKRGDLRVRIVDRKGEAARGAAVRISWQGRHGGTFSSRVHRANGNGETVFTRFRETRYLVHAHRGAERGAAVASISGRMSEVVVRLHGAHYVNPHESHGLGLLHHHHDSTTHNPEIKGTGNSGMVLPDGKELPGNKP
jgi:hypothetical protein